MVIQLNLTQEIRETAIFAVGETQKGLRRLFDSAGPRVVQMFANIIIARNLNTSHKKY